MKIKINYFFVSIGIVLFSLALILIKKNTCDCEIAHERKHFELNYPYYETKNFKIYETVNQLLDVKERISPGGGYFSSHSRWAKLLVNHPHKDEIKYEIDIYYTYQKDGVVKLNACNIFVVGCSNGVSYQSDKGWFFSEQLTHDLCSQIAKENSLPMPIFSNEIPIPAAFTVSYQTVNDSTLLNRVVSFFENTSSNQNVLPNGNQIARLILSSSEPKSLTDLLNAKLHPIYQVILFDNPGYFQVAELSEADTEFTKKIISKDCYDCSMYHELMTALR